ncbi:chromate efflux transporter [Tolumonas osonensis]|uniref:Chromate transporter n=1 Tax=Tolumonas osonensis TaxID=675874 RepID=A0A841GL00_9GAMM|nr:chromate efflux transporter [Tolumonas osonensis]MBB6055162.1 chromate transporter [Tolumonas osonensis]
MTLGKKVDMAQKISAWQILIIFLRLGLTSFGGPVAHLGYFREEFVVRRHWLSAQRYADLVALCQFLPGPASSQVGMALGLVQGGYRGALAAWCGFTLPSAMIVILFAAGLTHWQNHVPAGVLHGLKVVAVAVVAQAVWGMAGQFCRDKRHISLMLMATTISLLWPSVLAQMVIILVAAGTGYVLFRTTPSTGWDPEGNRLSHRHGVIWLLLFVVLLVSLPILATVSSGPVIQLLDIFYRTGALVFGGGHVVLPLLQAEVVPAGLVSNETFLAGYGATQAVPGPLFTFAAFLGASVPDLGWFGGVVALTAIFLPSFLLVAGVLPFWERLRRFAPVQAALSGINAAVVGILLAALYQPVWTSAVQHAADFVLALLALMALMVWRISPWLVVIGCGVGGWVIALV